MSSPAAFPLQLERTVFTRFVVLAIPEHQPGDGDHKLLGSPQNKISVVKDPERPNTYVASMRTIVNPDRLPKDPYFVDVECMALLVADGTLSDADALRGATITGHNVVYGAIREAVAWLTARQPYGPLILGLSVLTPKTITNSEEATTVEPAE